jgi:four helix bundle protein
VESYQNLLVWQRAVQLAVALHRLTDTFPDAERDGLAAQIRRLGVSIASCIADGSSRSSPVEHKHFLNMARGAAFELQTQLVISRELGLGSPRDLDHVEHLSTEVNRLILTSLKSL